MPWLTPDESTGGGYVSRPLYIPEKYVSHVSGALLQMCDAWNWESFGDTTPDEAASAMRLMLDAYYRGNPMIGVITYYATTTIPDNMLHCDGNLYARADYPDLYAAIDTQFIEDADYFRTPNLDGVFVLGSQDNIGETGGEENHTLVGDEIPSHPHGTHYQYGPDTAAGYLGAISTAFAIQPTDGATDSYGGGQAHNNMPPFIKLRAGIIYR